jgi:hypothetical protein
MSRPSFSISLAKGLSIAAKHRGWKAYIPIWIIISLAVGIVLANKAPTKIWNKDYATGIAIYSGLLTFNGILMAVGWTSFAKIYEVIGRGEFGKFLRRNDALDMHLLYIDIAQYSLLSATLTSAIALIVTPMPVIDLINRFFLAGSIASTIYALIKCASVNRAIHDLIWDSSSFE